MYFEETFECEISSLHNYYVLIEMLIYELNVSHIIMHAPRDTPSPTSGRSGRRAGKPATAGSSSDESEDQAHGNKPQTKYFKSRDRERQQKKKKGNYDTCSFLVVFG